MSNFKSYPKLPNIPSSNKPQALRQPVSIGNTSDDEPEIRQFNKTTSQCSFQLVRKSDTGSVKQERNVSTAREMSPRRSLKYDRPNGDVDKPKPINLIRIATKKPEKTIEVDQKGQNGPTSNETMDSQMNREEAVFQKRIEPTTITADDEHTSHKQELDLKSYSNQPENGNDLRPDNDMQTNSRNIELQPIQTTSDQSIRTKTQDENKSPTDQSSPLEQQNSTLSTPLTYSVSMPVKTSYLKNNTKFNPLQTDLSVSSLEDLSFNKPLKYLIMRDNCPSPPRIKKSELISTSSQRDTLINFPSDSGSYRSNSLQCTRCLKASGQPEAEKIDTDGMSEKQSHQGFCTNCFIDIENWTKEDEKHFCDQLISEINKFRENPMSLIGPICERTMTIKANIEGQNSYLDIHGDKYIDCKASQEKGLFVINYLSKVKPVLPIQPCEGLRQVASDHCAHLFDTKDYSHLGKNNLPLQARVEEYGDWSGSLFELLSSEYKSPLDHLLYWILNDSSNEKKNIQILLSPTVLLYGTSYIRGESWERSRLVCVLASYFTPFSIPIEVKNIFLEDHLNLIHTRFVSQYKVDEDRQILKFKLTMNDTSQINAMVIWIDSTRSIVGLSYY